MFYPFANSAGLAAYKHIFRSSFDGGHLAFADCKGFPPGNLVTLLPQQCRTGAPILLPVLRSGWLAAKSFLLNIISYFNN